MSRTQRSGTIAFKPRARLLKLIGEELISDDVVAVSELVKNSHDADAITVTVAFRGVTGPAGEIEVRDDGCGLNLDTLLGRWMEPAASTKTGVDRLVTPRGRRTLGEKGVGRFAADKLASCLEIISRCPGSPDEIRALIDWDLFDNDTLMLEEIKNHWELRPARSIPCHGTLLRMSEPRSVWNERMFRRLSIRLGRLLSPFCERDKFAIHIESDEFPQYSGELRSDILDCAPYRIEADFDGLQTISFASGRKSVQQRWNGVGELCCGPIRIRLFVYDLDGEALARIGPRMEVRAWLKEWTGVSIYRDGFRIWPYGEPHDDWLRLDQRRVNNPVEHLSNNQVIGFIDISRDGNPELMDQTNREGLINNKALDDLRRLVYFVVQIIEAERQRLRHPIRRAQLAQNGTKENNGSVVQELSILADQVGGDIARVLKRISHKLNTQQKLDQEQYKQLVDGYAGLAAVGQLAADIAPAVQSELTSLRAEIETLRDDAASRNGSSSERWRATLSSAIERVTDKLRMLQLAAGDSERRTIDVIAEIAAFQEAVTPLLEFHNVRMELDCQSAEVLRTNMRPEHFYCVLQTLTANSLDWLQESAERRIRLSVSADNECCEIVFSDSGPGIPWGLGPQVFDPRFSTKEGGRGMGLTLAARLLESCGGEISVIRDGRRRGANFRIRLPRKRSRATFASER